ncbi:MAG TPA: TPM domain-containing protein [Thermoanaerobaculia bacterium]|nr:TPM domain-containing protein [Thermoanaerobaculia bacterium]
MKQKDLVAHIDREAVEAAIAKAEAASSAEIRVHLEPSAHGREVQRLAERTFERLGMTRTALRNGVLIFLAAKEQQFAVIGDRGIHEKVGTAFWEAVAAHMVEHFRKGEMTEGLIDAVREVGERLAQHFPHAGGEDRDELSNQISVGSPPPPSS